MNEKCGTYAGYRHHVRNKEKVCNSCRVSYRNYQKEWAKNNPDKIKAKKKRYRAKPEKQLIENISLIKYRKENATKLNESNRIWRQKNPDKVRMITARKRAIKFNAITEKYTSENVIDLYGNICHICGNDINMKAPRMVGKNNWEMSLHLDHVIPLSKGGSDTLDNIKPAHALCNLKKGCKVLQ